MDVGLRLKVMLCCPIVQVFQHGRSALYNFLLLMGESMDKTCMLLSNKTANGFVPYTGLSNIKKHCRLQLKRKEETVLMENKVLTVCFVWSITPKVLVYNFQVNIKCSPFKNKTALADASIFRRVSAETVGGRVFEMLQGQMLPLSCTNYFAQPHYYF